MLASKKPQTKTKMTFVMFQFSSFLHCFNRLTQVARKELFKCAHEIFTTKGNKISHTHTDVHAHAHTHTSCERWFLFLLPSSTKFEENWELCASPFKQFFKIFRKHECKKDVDETLRSRSRFVTFRCRLESQLNRTVFLSWWISWRNDDYHFTDFTSAGWPRLHVRSHYLFLMWWKTNTWKYIHNFKHRCQITQVVFKCVIEPYRP